MKIPGTESRGRAGEGRPGRRPARPRTGPPAIACVLLAWLLLGQPGPARAQQQESVSAPKASDTDVATLEAQAAELDRERDEVLARTSRATQEAETVARQLASLHESRAKIDKRLEQGGMTDWVRSLLRRAQDGLPDAAALRRRIAHTEADLSQVQSRQLELEEWQSSLDTVEARAKAAAVAGLDAEEAAAGRARVEAAVAAQGGALGSLLSTIEGEVEALDSLESAQRELLDAGADFADFIEGNILWTRSAPPLNAADLPRSLGSAWEALRWLLAPDNWLAALLLVWRDAVRNPLVALFTLALLVALVQLRPMLVRRLARAASHVPVPGAGSDLRWTLEAAAATLLLAAVIPAVALLVAWRLSAPEESGGEFANALAAGLRDVARLVFVLFLIRETCRPRGLGPVHFGWPEEVCRSLRRNLGVLSWTLVPCALVVALLRDYGNDAWSDSLGRLAFLGACLALAFVGRRLLRRDGPTMRALAERAADTMAGRSRLAWQPLVVGTALALAGFAAAGYLDTALMLELRALASLVLLFVLAVADGILRAWVTRVRRRLAREQALRRRVAQPAGVLDAESAPPVTEEPDLGMLDAKARRFLRLTLALPLVLGLWRIWADVLPALDVLQRVPLWHRGETAITLADLLASLAAVLLAVMATRNIPGMLEFTILRRLPLDAGGSYAVVTLVRYALAIAGGAVAVMALGVAWSDVQWLAAAVTVGLGFGLQEIFANFVSGVILLLERPIRVGDTVTVSGVTGTVERIRMRATTVRDWDRKELVVPNKEFITGNLVNWTLADTVLRVIIRVGVAYGSDTRLVTRLLAEVAANEPDVLKDPRPVVVFGEFGDSTLNFELRCFVETPERVRRIPHQLHLAIDDAFRANGVEIAFPQRDLHIRSIAPEFVGTIAARSESDAARPPTSGDRPGGPA